MPLPNKTEYKTEYRAHVYLTPDASRVGIAPIQL